MHYCSSGRGSQGCTEVEIVQRQVSLSNRTGRACRGLRETKRPTVHRPLRRRRRCCRAVLDDDAGGRAFDRHHGVLCVRCLPLLFPRMETICCLLERLVHGLGLVPLVGGHDSAVLQRGELGYTYRVHRTSLRTALTPGTDAAATNGSAARMCGIAQTRQFERDSLICAPAPA